MGDAPNEREEDPMADREVDHIALRVQFTPILLASRLRGLEAELQRRNSSGFPEVEEIAIAPSNSSSQSSPLAGSPVIGNHSPPSVNFRERSHHKMMMLGRPAITVSPDADRRALNRAALFETAAAEAEDSYPAAGAGGGSNSFTHRCGAGARDLAVTVPPRQLVRPMGGPVIVITSRPPSSQASSRPCSAASSVGSSRPSSANVMRGCPTPGSRPGAQSQRRMILEFDHKLSTVLPGQLLIGAEHSARDEAKLASEGVTAIVNCAGMICANHFPHRFHYLKLNLLDTAREDISAVFYDVLDFIDDTIEQEHGTVFVHCQHGVSRSATLVIAYVMWKRGLAYDDALELVRAARPTVNPNIGFACALLQWGASIEAPPQTTQAWALGTALGSGALLGDLTGDLTCGTSAAAAAAVASGSAAPASAGAEGPPRTMHSVALPTCPHLLTLDGGAFESEEALARERELVRELLCAKGGGGPLVVQRETAAAVWLPAGAPTPESDLMALERHVARLRKYHHLPSDAAVLYEREGGESETFWSLFAPPPPPLQRLPSRAMSTGSAGGSFEPPALSSLTKSFTDLDVDLGGGGGWGVQGAMPPMTGRVKGARPPRTFGLFAGGAAGAEAGAEARPMLVTTLERLGSEISEISEISESSCSESVDHGASSRSRSIEIATTWGSSRDAGAHLGAHGWPAPLRMPSDRSDVLSRENSSYAVHVDQMDESGRMSSLDEMMAVTALQTVAVELLVVLQGPNAHVAAGTAGGEVGAEGGGAGGGADADADAPAADGAEVLTPVELLLAYQSTITTQPRSSEEAHEMMDAIMGLLAQIAPALAPMPTFESLSHVLESFLDALPSLQGSQLLTAEEALLAEISKAAERDHEEQEALDDDGAGPRRMSS
eukprot:jgi/Chrpa1/5490/Chrysochromulina_OHIO_Genome00012615-RA